LPHRILQDVTGLLIKLMVIAQAMIEKIALPRHPRGSCQVTFPFPDRWLQSGLARERQDSTELPIRG